MLSNCSLMMEDENPRDDLTGESFGDYLRDIDPDVNLLNDYGIPDSNYLNEDDFQELIKDINGHKLSFLHLNARSLKKNFDAIDQALDSFKFPFSVIGISETWHTDLTKDSFEIDNYVSLHRVRQDRRGGGVSFYISSTLSFKERTDLALQVDDVEFIFIEILVQRKKIIVGLIYRAPTSDRQIFVDEVTTILRKIRTEKIQCFLMGDFNIDMMENDESNASNSFAEAIYSHGFFPLITKPTRIDEIRGSATLIDNIFSNDLRGRHNLVSGILITDVSDHFMVMAISKDQIVSPDDRVTIKTRTMKPERVELFKDLIAQTDWTEALRHENAQVAYSTFTQRISAAYDEAFPLRILRVKSRRFKPWLTDGLKVSIKRKNKLYMQLKRSPSLYSKSVYNEYKKVLIRTLRAAELNHNSELLNQNKHNLRKSWDIMKQILGKNSKPMKNEEFENNGEIISDMNTIANEFNNFFVNLGPNLAQKITPRTGQTPESFLPHDKRCSQTIFVSPITVDEVYAAIGRLKSGSGAGWDCIKPSMIKEIRSLIVLPLTQLINKSLDQGTVPWELKVARVVPLFKGGEKHQFVNYRPVSILPCVSKVYERIVYDRIVDFLNRNNAFSECQYGFRKNFSTSLALTQFVDKATEALDARDCFIGIYVDLSKAFDTVDHNILLRKLDYYGIRGRMKDWLADYLRDRKQYVVYGDASSGYLPITCGVPQGSILGPLLFIIYLNDLPLMMTRLSTIMFADDTTFHIRHSDLNSAVAIVNSQLSLFAEWLRVNRLSLNTKKTKSMLFTLNHAMRDRELYVHIDGDPIYTVKETKFLGVMVQNNLSWNSHIRYVSSKISKTLGIFYKVRFKLPKSTLISLYYTFLYPYIQYCNVIWGGGSITHLSALHRLQKCAIRLIHNLRPRDSTQHLFAENRILTVFEVNLMDTIIFAFRWHKSLLPSPFHSFFSLRSDTSQRETRQANNLQLIQCRTETRRRSLKYRAAFHYNHTKQQLNIISIHSVSVTEFKRVLKQAILLGDL